MAVAKAAHIEPLHQVRLDVSQKALVVGGGVAGMEAALGIADQGIPVFLVERSNRLGGVAHKLRSTWQGEPVKPYLEELTASVRNHPNIRVFMQTEPVETTGIMGNFTTTLMTAGESLTETVVEHGATILATGGKEYTPTEYLYGENPNVLTHFDLDAALDADDPRIAKAQSAAFIQCVGSRTTERPYCSRLCCTHTLKSALGLKERNPDMDIYVLYRDIRSYGFREALYKEAREKGVIFMRYNLEDNLPEVSTTEDGRLSVRVRDHVLQMPVELNPDLLVLATAVLPNENKDLFELFKVPINADGFLVEAHAKLRPVDFGSEGIFMAGLAHYPKALDESIAQARASVSRTMTILSRDSIMVGGVVAEVDPDKCAVCVTCVRTCPYHIPYIGEEGHAVIEAAECHGCGCCVAECPGKAIQLKHFTDEQIVAKTAALFEKKKEAAV
jgi:heterodisulfide reductase subunit A-like polyferredoxin